MQVIFLNTFEKVAATYVMQAQCSICEHDGVWSVMWVEEAHEMQQETQSEIWFEGPSWEEMMTAFRHGISIKMGEGYTPFIDGLLDSRKAVAQTGGIVSMLQCYGELHANAVIFEQLRQWRRAKAVSERKSAYLVANNRILHMISCYVPHTAEQLQQIPGWGQLRQTAYSDEVLAVTAQFEQPRPFPLDWVSGELDAKQFTQWIFKQKETKYKAIMDRQKETRHIMNSLPLGKTIQQLQEELSMPRRDVIDRIERLEGEGHSLEPIIENELQQVSEGEKQLIIDALREVGDRYLKPVFHKVYGDELPNDTSVDVLYERLRLIRLKFRRNQSKAM